MKKTILLFAAAMPFMVANAGTITTKTYAKSSEGCSGSGICTVTTTSSNMTGYIDATWTYEAGTRRLQMEIPDEHRQELPEELLAMLAAGHFLMQAEFRFPQEVASMLESDEELVIGQGTYSVNREADSYKIVFTLE
jgi:hypothetical protein